MQVEAYEWRGKSEEEILEEGAGAGLTNQQSELQTYALDVYKRRLRLGVAPEQARIDLPLTMYTQIMWKMDLRSLFNMGWQRLESHQSSPQQETFEVVRAMMAFVKDRFPVSYKAFEEHILRSITLSKTEIEDLDRYLPDDEPTGIKKKLRRVLSYES
jgi:thymidylate synthase (FAD)